LDNEESKQEECTKLLSDLFETKKVKKMIELDPKVRVNIGKLIKSVANCYDCRVSKFNESQATGSEEDFDDEPEDDNYYEIELVDKNKLIITDKRSKKKHEINVAEFRSFLENKLDIKTDDNSDCDTTNTEESKEDKMFHFLKFELILREFYQKNELRKNLKNGYRTNDQKKVDLPFSVLTKQPIAPFSYDAKKLAASPAIKKNFFEDFKDDIKKISKRRKTMFYDNNMVNHLKNEDDVVEKKVPNSQVPKFRNNFNMDEDKEDKVSSFSVNFEGSKENIDYAHKNSLKISKRTSIFDASLTLIIDNEDDDKSCSEDSKDGDDN